MKIIIIIIKSFGQFRLEADEALAKTERFPEGCISVHRAWLKIFNCFQYWKVNKPLEMFYSKTQPSS